MATKSKAQLARNALVRLGVLDPDENPSQQEQDDVVAAMESLHEQYKEDGKMPYALDSLPPRYQEPFIDLTAGRIAPDFGGASKLILQREAEAKRQISRMSATTYNPKDNPYRDF